MRRAKYIELCRAEARKMLSPEDYEEIIGAITNGKEISFTYTDDQGKSFKYKAVRPIEFILTPGYYKGIKKIEDKLNPISNGEKTLEEKIKGTVYLWSYHKLHKRKHSFFAETIKDVRRIATLIDALTDPQRYSYFWRGET